MEENGYQYVQHLFVKETCKERQPILEPSKEGGVIQRPFGSMLVVTECNAISTS